ncbi:helix-turn-helix domain-containing protein (plasmid) [Skermanella rosea]|uniref:IclR family transcriptional regulator domain-containing protein n=1 Tax=Skermanella rosea TaxID=1817965 RepID=UPI001E510EE0|nr:IclR family transcriptional regulator C-terminal domain-containing protein [Skermanella rosea]UEM06824.1 helix-turn-helix domain-containing protein [Skermanella rosea]
MIRSEPPTPSKAASATAADPRSQTVQSLVRALHIMTILGEADGPMSLTELARAADLSPSTAHRLLTTLQQERYVRFDGATRSWYVGVQAFISGSGFLKTRNVVDLARPRMRQLMDQASETVNLAIIENHEVVYLAQVECHQMMRALAPPGSRLPLHCSAAGKALLARMAPHYVRNLMEQRGLPRFTAATLTTLEALEADLEQVRTRAYAVDNEEHAIGLRCVAATIYDERSQPIGALSVSGPKARVTDDRVASLGGLVRQAAAAVTNELGGTAPG